MIRFGIIGTNFITDEFIKCSRLVKGIKLNAVYSRTKQRAEEFARKNSIQNIFMSLKEMAKSDLIDAVYIASPNSLHSKQAVLFLENKKNVLCEKPIASNSYELEEMIKAAQDNEVLLMEAMKSSFLPNFKAIRDNLYKIGKVRRYFGVYCQYSSRYDKYKAGENPNTFNLEFSNGSLMDLGTYCLHPMIQLFGEPKSIIANGVLLESGVDGEGSLVLGYDDMEAIIMHSKITNSCLCSEIQGEKGTMIIDKISIPKNISIRYNDAEVEDITVQQSNDVMQYEVREFVDLVNQSKTESDICSYRVSRDVMKVLESARRQMGVIYPADID